MTDEDDGPGEGSSSSSSVAGRRPTIDEDPTRRAQRLSWVLNVARGLLAEHPHWQRDLAGVRRGLEELVESLMRSHGDSGDARLSRKWLRACAGLRRRIADLAIPEDLELELNERLRKEEEGT